MRDRPRRKPRMHGHYLRIPSWAALKCRTLPAHGPAASVVSIEIEKHRPIPVREPIVPEEKHGGASADGVLFEWGERLPPGMPIEIEFVLQPGDAPVVLRGEVVDAAPCEYARGLHRIRMGFIAATDAEVDAIALFVKRYYV